MIGSVIKPHEYVSFLDSINNQIQQARMNASKVVNHELVLLYTRIGQQIVEAQTRYGWSSSIVENLSEDLL